jgi:hypothetical protein
MGKKRKTSRVGLRNRPAKDARLNILISPELKAWMHEYAIEQHTTVTALITRYFLSLRESDEGGHVEQI